MHLTGRENLRVVSAVRGPETSRGSTRRWRA